LSPLADPRDFFFTGSGSEFSNSPHPDLHNIRHEQKVNQFNIYLFFYFIFIRNTFQQNVYSMSTFVASDSDPAKKLTIRISNTDIEAVCG
jgi:hypothetical protein